MEKKAIGLFAAFAVFVLASCAEEPQAIALNAVEYLPGPDEQGPALEQLIAQPVKRDQVFFANHDFSEKQADYLKARLGAELAGGAGHEPRPVAPSYHHAPEVRINGSR
mgnify:CR=1 FL=1